MIHKLFRATLLFVLVCLPSLLHAETGSVTFHVCNAGKAEVDIVVSQSGKVSTFHIPAADCATIASSQGPLVQAYVGIAFLDAHGQWGAARRLDLLPEWTTDVIDDFIDRNAHTASVRHGASSVTLPTELLLHPPAPQCHTDRSGPSAVSRLPVGATGSQKLTAVMQDNRLAVESGPICDQFEYTLNVEAYPDTKEVTFKQFCDPCDKKAEAAKTPGERANGRRLVASAQAMLASLGSLGAQVQETLDKEQADREAELAPLVRVNWSDIVDYIYLALRRQDSRMKPVPRHILIVGTVDTVTSPDGSTKFFNAYFKEDPKHQFAVCTDEREVFQDRFGTDFVTKMVGKTVEVEGWVDKFCRVGAGLKVTLVHQLRAIGPGVPATVAKVWNPADHPIPPTPTTPPAPRSNGPVRRPNQQGSARPADPPAAPEPSSARPTSSPSPPAQAAAPTPQTNPKVTPQAQAPTSEQPRRAAPTAEERKAIAEKFNACLQQAIKDHPNGGPELAKASAACTQIVNGK
jgi:hypothetical protein